MLMMTQSDMAEFKKLYQEAVKKNKDTFMFQERVVLTSYAKYVLEYLEGATK